MGKLFRSGREVLLGANAGDPAVYDAGHASLLPGSLVRREGDAVKKNPSVNAAYDGAGAHYDLFKKICQRDLLDDKGFPSDSTVHYGRNYDNAFWNGKQMVYGDGDGDLFGNFTKALDVIRHELTHGIVQFEANLAYEDQPGAFERWLFKRGKPPFVFKVFKQFGPKVPRISLYLPEGLLIWGARTIRGLMFKGAETQQMMENDCYE